LIAPIFKWLTLILFAYVFASFLAKPDWTDVIRSTVIPHVEFTGKYWATLVGIFGTTISPHLFFWQASQEVEEDREKGRASVAARAGATDAELRKSRTDVVTGMFFSNLIMYFIILTTAATLHAHGRTTIATAKDAAEALRPLAGAGAYWLFSLGLIGAGMIGVPVLAGSSAYAIAEAAKWQESLAKRLNGAREFYAVITGGLFGARPGLCRL
jgi:Mn2+/Fe2+ NRAMP family transporter